MAIRDRTDEEKQRLRQIIENAVLAFRPDVVRELEVQRDIPPPEVALQTLADADVPRVLKQRLVLDGLLRTPAVDRDRTELRDSAAQVLHATIPRDKYRIDEAMQHLDDVLALDGQWLTAEHWQKWVEAPPGIFDFSIHEKTFQTSCNDRDEVEKFTPPPDRKPMMSRLIVAEFWTDLPPSAFTGFVDPRRWPELSVFWTEMKALGDMQYKNDPPTGYNCDFRETVVILGTEVKVPLQVAHRKRPDRVWVRFNIARNYYPNSVPVDVDTGTVSAESRPGGPAPTRVQATKYVHWKQGYPNLTSVACDFGYAELMGEMAYSSLDEPAPHASSGGTSVDDAVNKFVTDVSKEWKGGVDECGPPLRKLIGRFTGASWSARWVNDLLDINKVQLERSGNVASHIRRLADSLKAANAGKDEHE